MRKTKEVLRLRFELGLGQRQIARSCGMARAVGADDPSAARRRLPDERHSLTHHFSVGGQEGYVTVGLYEDGLPGELFIRMAKEGSTVSGLYGFFRNRRVPGAAVWCPVAGPVRQVQPHTV